MEYDRELAEVVLLGPGRPIQPPVQRVSKLATARRRRMCGCTA